MPRWRGAGCSRACRPAAACPPAASQPPPLPPHQACPPSCSALRLFFAAKALRWRSRDAGGGAIAQVKEEGRLRPGGHGAIAPARIPAPASITQAHHGPTGRSPINEQRAFFMGHPGSAGADRICAQRGSAAVVFRCHRARATAPVTASTCRLRKLSQTKGWALQADVSTLGLLASHLLTSSWAPGWHLFGARSGPKTGAPVTERRHA